MTTHPTIGAWAPHREAPSFQPADLCAACQRVREPANVVLDPVSGQVGVAFGGETCPSTEKDSYLLLASLPPLYPEWLGDRSFTETHGLRFPYVAGAMANGISTAEMVVAMAKAKFLSIFGAAGLSLGQVESNITAIEEALGPNHPGWGSNLINSPNEPDLERAVCDLYLRRGVKRISASAYMSLTPSIVRYACTGLKVIEGRIQRANHIFAKVSRPEVASLFLEPPPGALLSALVREGQLTAEEAQLAQHVSLAEDLIAEADSGGHTDRRPMTVLFAEMMAVRERVLSTHRYEHPIRIGIAGGLGTPGSVAAAFAQGAAFVLTGSVNQACVESGLGQLGKEMLAKAGMADMTMAPAADMFELGVEVQVLLRGTMFAPRARKLYELYRSYGSLESVPNDEIRRLERQVFRAPLSEVWKGVATFWQERDPTEIERAERDPHHKMALVFRSYLGQASKWAIQNEHTRAMDFQIWCGPAMGAFNTWTAGSYMAEPENRHVVDVACNLLEGAAVVTRAQLLRSAGAPIPTAGFQYRPRPLGPPANV